MRQFFWILVLGLCVYSTRTYAMGGPPSGKDLETVVWGTYCALENPEQRVITNNVDWQQLWGRMYAQESPMPELPKIDFGQKMVLADFLGTRSSSGYIIEISDVKVSDSILEVSVLESTPGRNCLTTQALTQPFHVALIPRWEKAIRFNTSRTVTDCLEINFD